MISFLILAGLWVLYFFMHSVLASIQVKQWVRMKLRWPATAYRMFYVIVSTVGLAAILFYAARIDESFLIAPVIWLKISGIVLILSGIILFRQSFRQYDLSGFLGFTDEEETGNQFKTNGILQHVRHPIYLATILLVGGFVLFYPKPSSIVMFVCVLLYLIIGIGLEEKKLIKLFGQDYVTYKKKVPGLIPRFKPK